MNFPWQLLYDERMGLTTDLARIEQQIQHLHWEAEQLRPAHDVIARRLDAVNDALERYEANVQGEHE